MNIDMNYINGRTVFIFLYYDSFIYQLDKIYQHQILYYLIIIN